MTFRWIFHLRGSLSEVCDELNEHGIGVAPTTVLRWLKKAGEECARAIDLFHHKDRQAIKTFLHRSLKPLNRLKNEKNENA